MTSRKCYLIVAAAINTELRRVGGGEKRVVLIDLATAMCNEFEKDNPQFDRQRFLAAALP